MEPSGLLNPGIGSLFFVPSRTYLKKTFGLLMAVTDGLLFYFKNGQFFLPPSPSPLLSNKCQIFGYWGRGPIKQIADVGLGVIISTQSRCCHCLALTRFPALWGFVVFSSSILSISLVSVLPPNSHVSSKPSHAVSHH